MKPDIEINGRYFKKVYLAQSHQNTYNVRCAITHELLIKINRDNIDINSEWVELEQVIDGDVDDVHYIIKITESGKAVVLTELPKKGNECYVCGEETYGMTYTICDNCINKKPKHQSPDELAEEICEILKDCEFKDEKHIGETTAKMELLFQEYHRRRMRQELCDFFVEIYYQISQGNISTKNTPEQIVNQWIESRNNKNK